MNSEKKIKKAKAPAAGRKALKIGSFSITVTAVVIGIAILLNLFVNELPGTITKLDTSSLQLFTVSTMVSTAYLEANPPALCPPMPSATKYRFGNFPTGRSAVNT